MVRTLPLLSQRPFKYTLQNIHLCFHHSSAARQVSSTDPQPFTKNPQKTLSTREEKDILNEIQKDQLLALAMSRPRGQVDAK